jgi:hypothetical protein
MAWVSVLPAAYADVTSPPGTGAQSLALSTSSDMVQKTVGFTLTAPHSVVSYGHVSLSGGRGGQAPRCSGDHQVTRAEPCRLPGGC